MVSKEKEKILPTNKYPFGIVIKNRFKTEDFFHKTVLKGKFKDYSKRENKEEKPKVTKSIILLKLDFRQTNIQKMQIQIEQ